MRFTCGTCGQRYKADDSFAGEDLECSKCGATISVPALEESPEPLKTIPSTPKLSLSLAPKTAQESSKTVHLPPKSPVPSEPGTPVDTEPSPAPKLAMPKKTQEREAGGIPEEATTPKLTMPSSAGAKPRNEEPQETPKLKVPKLAMPTPPAEKTQEQDTEVSSEDPAAGNCPSCGSPLPSKTAVICTQCGHNLKVGMNVNTLKKAKAAGKLGIAIGIGAGAALLSGAIWAGIAVWLKVEIGWIACLVGFITGAVVCLVTPERSARMGGLAVLLACIGMLCGKMLTAEYLIRDTFQSFTKMAENFTKADKQMGQQFRDRALMAILTEEMKENGEIRDANAELGEDGEKASKAYNDALKKANEQYKQNEAKVRKKFATLSKEDKARLQKKMDRALLVIPLQQEMIDNGEIPKPDDSWKELAPKSFKEKPSKEYLEALKKYSMQVAENLKKVKKKLYTLSDAEAERLKNNMGSSISNQISYWQKLKMVMSYWDILWFLLAVSTAWGLGNGSSNFFQRD